MTECYLRNRARNMVMIRLDFNEDAFVQKNVVDRMPLIDRMAGYGGTIGKV